MIDKQNLLKIGMDVASLTQEAPAQSFSPGFMLMQVQMLLAENLGDQMKDVADKIKFLKTILQKNRGNLTEIQKFMAQNTRERGGKQVIDATAAQFANVLDSMSTFNYDVENKTATAVGIEMFDIESQHEIIEDESTFDGMTTTFELRDFMLDVASDVNEAKVTGDNEGLIDKAKRMGDGDHDERLSVFYQNKRVYYPSENGNQVIEPIFSVYVEQFERYTEAIKAQTTDIEAEIDTLSTKLNDLTEKRKAALEGANQAVRKLNEAQTNSVSKM